MLTEINMGTVVMVLDSMHVHFFSVSNDEFCKDVILFGVDNICSAHADNRYLVFVEGPIDEIDDTINSSKSWKMYTAVFIC